MMMPDRTMFVFCDAGIRLKEPPWSFHSQKVQGDLGLCVAFSLSPSFRHLPIKLSKIIFLKKDVISGIS